MLISVLNLTTNKWEIENMEDTNNLKAEMLKMDIALAEKFKDSFSNTFKTFERTNDKTIHYCNCMDRHLQPGVKCRCINLDVPRETGYEALRAEAVPNLFTVGFIEAARREPIYSAILCMLQQGQSPYEVIEWLAGAFKEKVSEIHYMIRANSDTENS